MKVFFVCKLAIFELAQVGCQTGTRTPIARTKTWSPTIRRSGNLKLRFAEKQSSD
jgi:hypothetical protein